LSFYNLYPEISPFASGMLQVSKNTIFTMKSVAIPKAIPLYFCMAVQEVAATQPKDASLIRIFIASFF